MRSGGEVVLVGIKERGSRENSFILYKLSFKDFEIFKWKYVIGSWMCGFGVLVSCFG